MFYKSFNRRNRVQLMFYFIIYPSMLSVVDRRGSLDQTRRSASRLIWWSVPVNLTWSGTSDQVTVIIIYIYQYKNVKTYTVDDQTYQDKGGLITIRSQSSCLGSGNNMVIIKPKLISIPDYTYKKFRNKVKQHTPRLIFILKYY